MHIYIICTFLSHFLFSFIPNAENKYLLCLNKKKKKINMHICIYIYVLIAEIIQAYSLRFQLKIWHELKGAH